MEGALLRLRPKVMTVSTVVAGLLPIMWSTRVGAEVMKPLATPVLGGMVSSLLHVLIVTPVIFFWIHERRLGLREEPTRAADGHGSSPRRRRWRRPCVVAVSAAVVGERRGTRDGPARSARRRPPVQSVQTVKAAGRRHRRCCSATGALRQRPERVHDRVPVERRPPGRRRHGSRRREHADAGHGDVERPARCAAPACRAAMRRRPSSGWRERGR